MTTHELKVWPEYYTKLLAGTKRAEARWGDDRQYAAGDWCWFREYDPATKAYTGNSCQARVRVAERVAERVAPAAFGATGDALWLIELDEVSGIASAAIRSPIGPPPFEVITCELGLAPPGTTTVTGLEAWTWIPVDAAATAVDGPRPGTPQRAVAVELRGIHEGAHTAAFMAWVDACMACAADGARLAVLRGRGQETRLTLLVDAVVTRVKGPGLGGHHIGEVDIAATFATVDP
jgi:hypothetical protein